MTHNAALSAVYFHEGTFPLLAEQAFRLRHEIFNVQSGWGMKTIDGLEKDQFDTAKTVHCALFAGAEMVCYFRACRCDGDYLSACVFPYLAVNRAYSASSDDWDISRFIVRKDHNYLSSFLYGLVFRFIIGQNAKNIICIITPARHRQLKRVGFVLRPYGPALAVKTDEIGRPELAMACEVPMPEQNFSIVRPLIGLTRHMEILDETFVFRSGRATA